MSIERVRNDPAPGPLAEDDFVKVMLNVDIKGKPPLWFTGYIVDLDGEWIRMRAHESSYGNPEDSVIEKCRGIEVAIPKGQVLFVAFPSEMPTGCYCSQGMH